MKKTNLPVQKQKQIVRFYMQKWQAEIVQIFLPADTRKPRCVHSSRKQTQFLGRIPDYFCYSVQFQN